MKQEFFTKNGKLELDPRWVRYTRLTKEQPDYWIHSLLLLVIILVFSLVEISEGKQYKWVRVAIVLVWMSPHFYRLFRYLFVLSWKNSFRLEHIRSVRIPEPANPLEQDLIMVLRSGRIKIYTFRSSEQAAEAFAGALMAAGIPAEMPASGNGSFQQKESF